MEVSLCEELLSIESPALNIDDQYWTYIANCVFNAYLSYTAIMMNILTIHAMRNSSSLPKTLKTLLLSLAVSDLGVGLLAQPFYSALMGKWAQQNNPNCSTIFAFFITTVVFAIPSFLGVMALSADRFLAIHLHLKYQELVTHKRVVAVVISIWLTSPLILLVYFTSWIPKDISLGVIVCCGILCLVITALLNFKIYLAARRHKIQIQAAALQLQEQTTQDSTMTTFASVRKSALGTFYVYLVFIICYFPRACNWAFVLIYGKTTTTQAFSLYSWTLMFLNSSLNPVIYCWKMKQIRHSIMDVLRSIFPTRN